MVRQQFGQETWERLLQWGKGQAPSERLAAQILISDKFMSIDPSHPLGGRDDLKDIVCTKDDKKWIAAAYFPRGQQAFNPIKNKFRSDLKGLDRHNVDGIAFITNQELSLGQRKSLIDLVPPNKLVEIYHLERLSAILNGAANYGLRLEFLDIEMTREEQLSYMAVKDQIISGLINTLATFGAKIDLINEKKEDTKNAPEVYPDSSFGYNWRQKSFKKCSYCDYGYKIIPLGYTTISPASTTCPKCGNTEEYIDYLGM